jgi:hypothetical protein
VWGSSPSNNFSVGDGGVLHYDGNLWTEMNNGAGGKVFGIWGASSSDVFAVGYAGAILHYPVSVPSMVNTVTPGSGELGETLDVIVNGSNLKGATGITFGSGVAVNSFTVDTPSRITANITISADATVGARSVSALTGLGAGALYSGFVVKELAPAPSPSTPVRSGTSWLLGLWVLLGIVAAGLVVGGLAFFLLNRGRKGPKPTESKPEEHGEEQPERKLQGVQAPATVSKEQNAPDAAQLESVAALKARMTGGGRSGDTGGAVPEETCASDEEDAAGEKPSRKKDQRGSPRE